MLGRGRRAAASGWSSARTTRTSYLTNSDEQPQVHCSTDPADVKSCIATPSIYDLRGNELQLIMRATIERGIRQGPSGHYQICTATIRGRGSSRNVSVLVAAGKGAVIGSSRSRSRCSM